MKTRAEIIEYLRSSTADLADLADAHRWNMLAYLFRMARLESEKLVAVATDLRHSTRPEAVTTPLGYWDLDVSRDRMFSDEHTAALFNLDKDAGRRGKSLTEWQRAVHPDDIDHVAAHLMNSIETGSEYNPRFRVVAPDQSIRYVEAHGRCLFDAQGRPSRFPGTIRQVSVGAARPSEIDIDLLLKRGKPTH